MSRFSRLFASGLSLRFASATVTAAMFAGLLTLPNSARAQGLLQAPTPNLGTGVTPQAVAAADLNRSGWTGLVVANSNVNHGASTISVFLGTGPNTYAGVATYSCVRILLQSWPPTLITTDTLTSLSAAPIPPLSMCCSTMDRAALALRPPLVLLAVRRSRWLPATLSATAMWTWLPRH